MDTEHDLTLLFKIAEHFIDSDGHDCSDQYVQYLAENIIASALHNPEFVGAIYDFVGDEMGQLFQNTTEEPEEEPEQPLSSEES